MWKLFHPGQKPKTAGGWWLNSARGAICRPGCLVLWSLSGPKQLVLIKFILSGATWRPSQANVSSAVFKESRSGFQVLGVLASFPVSESLNQVLTFNLQIKQIQFLRTGSKFSSCDHKRDEQTGSQMFDLQGSERS